MNTDFQAGAACRNITPPRAMVARSPKSVRFDQPGSPLQVKALALGWGQERFLLIALDLCFVPHHHNRLLLEALSAATGFRPQDLVLSASHTHSAPRLEPLDGHHPFFDHVKARAAEAAREAIGSLRPARLGHGLTPAVGASFNTRIPLPDGGVKFTRDWREGLASGRPVDPRLSVLRIDDLGLIFCPGEVLVEVSLQLAARSPLRETRLVSLCNGADGYLGTDQERKRGGYSMYTSVRYGNPAAGDRPLPYAVGAADCFLKACLSLIEDLDKP